MLTPSQLKYGVLGRLSAVRKRIQYRNFAPTCGEDAVVRGIDDQVAYLTRLLERGNMEMFLSRLAEISVKLAAQFWGKGLFLPELDELARRATLLIPPKATRANPEVFLHIASEIYSTGGHTRVIQDIILSLPEYRHELVITGPYEQLPEFPLVKQMMDQLPVQVRSLQSVPRADKSKELVSAVSNLNPKAIFLFTHPDDAIPNACIGSRSADRVVFFHHVDHFPSLGASRTDYTHVDMTPACHGICAARVSLRASMLNLTVQDVGTVNPARREAMIGVTCGSPHKYHGSTEFSYAQLLAALFASGVDKVLHIGQMPDEQKAQIRDEITANLQDADRVVFLGNTPSLAAKLIELSPDFYLVSHPIGSGKATIEAMSVGLPILHSRPDTTLLLLNPDVTFGTSVIAHTLARIPAAVRRLRNESEVLSKNSRLSYENHYSPKIFRQSLLSILNGNH